MNLVNITTITITLFAVIDMLGNIPLVIKLRKDYGEIESLKASVISAAIMIFTLLFGKTLFNMMGIETYHFALAGSFLLLYFGVRMVLGIEDHEEQKKQATTKATIFPVAFPLIAGPGTLSTIISMRSEFNDLDLIMGILLNGLIIFVVLKSATWIKKKLGEMGIILVERIFGIILIAIGMKMLIYNLIMSINEVVTLT